MPTLDKLITGQNRHVIYPVSDQIVRSILRYLGIYHIFENTLSIKDRTHLAGNTETDSHSDKINTDRCDVQITPTFNPSETKWNNYTYQFHRHSDSSDINIFGDTPIFYDKKVDVYLHEITVPCSVELDFKIRVKSESLAEMIYAALINKYEGDSSITSYSEIVFNYPMPDTLLLFLYHIYGMRQIENKPSFRDYLKIGSNDKFDILVNRTDIEGTGDKELVISKVNNYVLGQMDFSQNSPDENADPKDKFVDKRTIEFKYTFQFSRPNLLRFHYPVVIDNVMVPAVMLPSVEDTQHSNLPTTHKDAARSLYQGQPGVQEYLDDFYRTVRYPKEDDWVIPYVRYQQLRDRYYPLFIGLLTVDVDPQTGDTSLTVDMDDIFNMFDTRLEPHIRNYLDISIIGNLDLFNITFFANNNIVDLDRIALNGTTFSITNNVLPHKLYRIVVSISKDINWITRDSVDYILEHNEDFLPMIMNNFNYLLINKYVSIVRELMPYEVTIVKNEDPHKGYKLLGEKYGIGKAFRIGHYIIKSRRQPSDYR